jgi:hypothetical protein
MKRTFQKELLSIAFFLWLPSLVAAQIGFPDAGSRSHAMANTNLTLSDVYSVGNNQAGLAWLEDAAIGISALQYYGFEDATSLWLVTALPTKSGTFGLSAQYNGDKNFNQTKAGLAYGRKLGESFSAGVQLDYCHTRVTELGTGSALTFEAGLQFRPIDQLIAAARVFNPVAANMGEAFPSEQLPTLFSVGLAYLPSDIFTLAIEAEQQLNNSMNLKTGFEYRIIEELAIRGGYMSSPAQFTAGFGVYWKDLRIDGAAQFHPQLGMTPSFALQYLF